MSSSLWTEPRQRHRALVPAGTLPGSVNVCACVRACVCACMRVSWAALHTLWLSHSSLLGDVPQGTGDGVPHRTSATRTPRLSHAGVLN